MGRVRPETNNNKKNDACMNEEQESRMSKKRRRGKGFLCMCCVSECGVRVLLHERNEAAKVRSLRVKKIESERKRKGKRKAKRGERGKNKTGADVATRRRRKEASKTDYRTWTSIKDVSRRKKTNREYYKDEAIK